MGAVRAGQPSVLGGNRLIRALVVGLLRGHRRQAGRERVGGGSRHELGRDATHLGCVRVLGYQAMHWSNFVRRFGLGLRVVLALLMNVATSLTATPNCPL